MRTNLIVVAILVILVGAGSFYGGMKYQQTRRSGAFQQFANGQAGARRGIGAGNVQGASFRPVSGQIISMDDKSITVKLTDGSSKIVLLNDSTTINQTSQASKSDLKVGEEVAAFGSTNSDGSVTAQSVQLNPPERGNQTGTPNPTQ
jgi:hypothetical protein